MTTYTPVTKNATSYTAVSVSLTEDKILAEDDGRLLQEDSAFLILEQSVPSKTTYTSVAKNSTSYTPVSKN